MKIEFKKGCTTLLSNIAPGGAFKFKAQLLIRGEVDARNSLEELSIAMRDGCVLVMNPQCGKVQALHSNTEVTRLRAKIIACMSDSDEHECC